MPGALPTHLPQRSFEVTQPAPPHDPTERVCVYNEGGWEIRVFAWNDPKHLYLAPRGMLHLQLWHAEAGLSILTASGLTNGVFAVNFRGRTVQLHCYGQVIRFVVELFGFQPPCPHIVAEFEMWLVRASEIGAVAKPNGQSHLS